MSSLANPHPELPAADELVAYLDGELPPDECRRVEERLAADAGYRQQLRDLDQAWEALSALPTSAVDDGFARTTIELVSVAAAGDLSRRTSSAAAAMRSRNRWWALAGAAALLVGFLAAWFLLPNNNDRLLEDLPAIRYSDTLSQIGGIEFLRRLSAVPLQQLIGDEVALNRELEEFEIVASPSLETRREWVERLSTEQKAALATQARSFSEKPLEQDRLRTLAQEVSIADDATKKTFFAYGQWLDERTPGDLEQLRENLRDLSPDEQVEHMQALIRRENEQAARHLTAEDAKRLREEILKIAAERKEAFLSRMQRRGDAERARPFEGPGLALLILHAELRNDETRDATLHQLINSLSQDARDHWNRLSRRRSEAQWLQLTQWVRDAVQPKVGPRELEAFFANDLENSDRERLLGLPAGEMHAQLERLYLAREFGLSGALDWRGFSELGRGPGSPPRPPRDWRRDGPPRDRGRPGEPPPPDGFERNRFQPGPDVRPGPPPDEFRGRRPPRNLPGPPPDGPPPPGDSGQQPI